jgi:hypothetical protein
LLIFLAVPVFFVCLLAFVFAGLVIGD